MRTVPVLLYHGVSDECSSENYRFTVSPRGFEEQMRCLVDGGYRTLTVSEFLPALQGRADTLPERVALVTFDDGFANFWTDALPVLERLELRATLYVTTGFLGQGGRPGDNGRGDRMLPWAQVAELPERGVEVGAHSHTHPMLDTIRHAAARAEITNCKQLIEQHLQAPVASFAYPHGYSSAWVRKAVAHAGYMSACAVKNALSHTQDDPFAIARLTMEAGHGLDEFRRLLSGSNVAVAHSRDQLKTRAWRLARRGLAVARAPRSVR